MSVMGTQLHVELANRLKAVQTCGKELVALRVRAFTSRLLPISIFLDRSITVCTAVCE